MMNNKFAWIAAGVFGLAVAGLIARRAFYPPPSSPTHRTLGKGMLTLQKPEYPLTHVMAAEPTGGGDAGDDYHQAIKAYKDQGDALVDILAGRELSADQLKVLTDIQAHVAAGARRAKMTYAFRLTPTEFAGLYHTPEADDFENVARVCERLFQHYCRGDAPSYDQAERVMFDLLVMGQHMIDERARFETVLRGLGLQQHACQRLAYLYRTPDWSKPDRLEKVKEYGDGLMTMLDVYTELQTEVMRTGSLQTSKAKTIGDVFRLVRKHADPAMRSEATATLGIIKLTARKKGDRRIARKLIQKQLASHNPIERAAARAADALTIPDIEAMWRGEVP